jgi:hypothetical protein
MKKGCGNKMNIIEKISDTEYKVGRYHVTQRLGDMWTIIDNDKYIAEFYDKHTALSWANIMYTCGNLVGQGTRQLLMILAKEKIANDETLTIKIGE